MSKLRALKTDDELSAVPLSEPVLVELPGAMVVDTEDDDDKVKKVEPEDDGAKRLQADFEALQAKSAYDAAENDRLRQDAAEARRLAKEQAAENQRLRSARESDESTLINNGLSAAQSERDAAKAAFETAFEAGDAKAMANAQSKIGRAEARILHFESGAAEIADRIETRKLDPEPRRQEVPQDFAAQVRGNPNLLKAEQDWMIKHQDQFKDPDFNKRLDSAYQGAVSQRGLVRGSPEYFDFIEVKSGLKKAEPTNDDERDTSVSAPPSRNERGGDGRPTNGKIMLSPEQREIARSMGVTDIEYARQVAAFDTARRADPERYK